MKKTRIFLFLSYFVILFISCKSVPVAPAGKIQEPEVSASDMAEADTKSETNTTDSAVKNMADSSPVLSETPPLNSGGTSSIRIENSTGESLEPPNARQPSNDGRPSSGTSKPLASLKLKSVPKIRPSPKLKAVSKANVVQKDSKNREPAPERGPVPAESEGSEAPNSLSKKPPIPSQPPQLKKITAAPVSDTENMPSDKKLTDKPDTESSLSKTAEKKAFPAPESPKKDNNISDMSAPVGQEQKLALLPPEEDTDKAEKSLDAKEQPSKQPGLSSAEPPAVSKPLFVSEKTSPVKENIVKKHPPAVSASSAAEKKSAESPPPSSKSSVIFEEPEVSLQTEASVQTEKAEREEDKGNLERFDSVVPGRIEEVKLNEEFAVVYNGKNWIFLGETNPAQPSVVVFSKRIFTDEDTVFYLRAASQGETLLRFYAHDLLENAARDEYVLVRVVADTTDIGENTENITEISPLESSKDEKVISVKDGLQKKEGSSPEEMYTRAEKAFSEKRYEESLLILDDFFQTFAPTENSFDKAVFLKGRIYESPSDLRNIRKALDEYKKITAFFPESGLWDKAQQRITYIKRFYLEIR